ncbi:MAG TPA: thioredoxin [Hyphomicrobium sp.]|nr:thioredoxin [Hyphomicrobium sp.]
MEFGNRRPQSDGAAAADVIVNATTASFAKDVIEASRDMLVLVDFWATWCGPCKQLAPVLEKVVRSYGGRVRLVKVDVDANPAIAAQLRIQSMPTVYAFRDGRPLDGFMGAQPESVVREFVDRLAGEDLSASIDDVLKSGEELLEQNDLQGAAEIYAAVLQEDRENAAALAGLAQCYIKSDDLDRARQTIALVPPDRRELPAVQSVQAQLDLAEKIAGLGSLGDLEARIGANPADHQARFELAIALAGMDRREEAMSHLLEIVLRDRAWNEDGARRQLLQFFDAWGAKEPLVSDGRRRLSSILFR